MPKFAVINNETKKVVNAIIWDANANWSPPSGHSIVSSEGAAVGDTYNPTDQNFTKSNGSTVFIDKICLPFPLNAICFPILTSG